MIKHWQTNQEYHCFLTNAKTTFDSSERVRLQSVLASAREKLRLLDTDAAMHFLEPFYSNTGRPASNQPQILRSFVLFFLLVSINLTSPSLTTWVSRLKSDRVLASLLGCSVNSLPPLGSYYDFMDRLWTRPDHSLYKRGKLLSPGWNRKKPPKPKGKHQKASENRSSITDSLVSRILDGKDLPFNFEARLQKLFYTIAVLPSLKCGLIPDSSLTISGDGTSVHAHSNPNGHILPSPAHTLSQQEYASLPRHYSDPDASWGWDSDLDSFYFGYTLFQLSYHNPVLHADIPLLLRFTSARRHDSVSFLVAFHELEKHMPGLSIKNMCLDSAMDNLPTYRLLKTRNISALIDLNSKSGHPKTIHDNIRIDKNGTPVCAAGLPMVPNGNDYSSKGHIGCQMWRCPYGKDHKTKCRCSCTSSIYGRVIKTRPEWDIRLYTDIPRSSETYKKIYKQRTATERINNRILNDYGLHRMFIHTKEHYSFMTTMIGICIHLDARYKQQMQTAA